MKEKESSLKFETCTNCNRNSLLVNNEYKVCLCCGYQNKTISYNNEVKYNFKEKWWIENIKNSFLSENLPFLTDEIIKELDIGISKQFFSKTGNDPHASLTIPCYNKNKEIINLLFFKFSKKHVLLEKLQYMPSLDFIPLGLDKINNDKLYIVNTIKDYLTLYAVARIKSVLYFPYEFDFKKEGDVFHKIQDSLKDVKKFVFVEDNSRKLEKFSDEFSRRVGKEKCAKTKWTVLFEDDVVNAYNVYMKLNVDGQYTDEHLKYELQNELPYPVCGLHELYDVDDEMEMFYENGIPLGLSLGYPSLDEHFRVSEGRLTIVTGIPGHGKTTFLNSLLIKLSELHGWVHAVYSPESQPIARYFSDIIQIKTNKIYANVNNIKQQNDKNIINKYLNEKEKNDSKKWVNDHFKIILPDEDVNSDSDWSLDGVLELARQSIYRYGVKCLVIDPWNEIEHDRKMGQSETEYISKALTKIKRFTRSYGIHTFLVAHPTKLTPDYQSDVYQVPKPYDISGGAHWRNKADQCLCVYRFVGEIDNSIVDLYIQKIRYKEDGSLGRVSFSSDPFTGYIYDNVDQFKRNKYLTMRFTGKDTELKNVRDLLISNPRKYISNDEKDIISVDASLLQ